MAPQEQLGVMDGLGDHVSVSEETWGQNQVEENKNEQSDDEEEAKDKQPAAASTGITNVFPSHTDD